MQCSLILGLIWHVDLLVLAVWGINGLGLIQFIGLRVHNSSYDRPDIKPLNSRKPDLATRLLFTV